VKGKDEGGRMKDESVTARLAWLSFIIHPSDFTLFI
jgi:hypothetical protein